MPGVVDTEMQSHLRSQEGEVGAAAKLMPHFKGGWGLSNKGMGGVVSMFMTEVHLNIFRGMNDIYIQHLFICFDMCRYSKKRCLKQQR